MLSLLGFIAVLFLLPMSFVSDAASAGEGLIEQTKSHDEGLPNYDIREDRTAVEKLVSFRQAAGRNAVMIADLREEFVRGEKKLQVRVPDLKVEYNPEIKTPEVISAEIKSGSSFLSERSTAKRSDILRGFLKDHGELVGVDGSEVDRLTVEADYSNPQGGLSFVELGQSIDGIPVFRGEVKAGFTKNGEIVRVINNLAPGVGEADVSRNFGDPAAAVASAAQNIGHRLRDLEQSQDPSLSSDTKAVFGNDDWATTAEKMYFPTEPGVVVPAWRVLIWLPINAYYVVVDAETGTTLWRKNITEDQTQSATYSVWANPNALLKAADSPFPSTPGPADRNGQQGSALPRSLISRIGNEAPYTFNNNGWINDGGNSTDGNSNEAGLDRENPNGVDPNGKAVGSPNRVFNFPINPGVPSNPVTNSGDSPLPPGVNPTPCVAAGTSPAMIDFQKAAVTQLFFINNWFHDEMYLLGFTEAARNFQHDNFGRGGVGNDRVSAEAQDCSGVNNANFSTPADGSRGRMQMYIWTAPTPDFDGDLDADIVIHEYVHGLSNRLHGNSSGLSTNMARGMGEGWSDFYAHAMLSDPSDPINGIYTIAGYSKYNPAAGFNNYYYGIRRFPKAVMSSTGGLNNRPHNPLTFADIDSTQANTNDGAFPAAFGATPDQTHAAGEVWSSALWEVRAKYITRLGWEVGNRRILQHVTDGMKLAPLGPTFLQERDAIIAAALAGGSAEDVEDLWSGFAIRGLGFSASIQTAGTGSGTARVTEAFDLPNLTQTPSIVISDASGNNNGFPDPGEQLTITLPLTNNTGSSATGVSAQLVGGNSADYGTISHGTSVTRNFTYTVPNSAVCGSRLQLLFNVSSSLGPVGFAFTPAVGEPIVTASESFDNIAAPGFPAGWTVESLAGGIGFVSSTVNPSSPPNAAFALNPATVGGGTNLTSPEYPISTSAGRVTFRNRYDTEAGWDGGVLEISVGGGAFQDILAAGGSFSLNGYNGTLGANGVNNPLSGRAAWTGSSNGYVSTVVDLPASAAGQMIRLRWRFGADDNTAVVGWYVDSVVVQGNSSCIIVDPGTARADFDGDGKSDVSLFRPTDGNWYLDRSTAGFTSINFGLSEDIITPGDFDGDGKADTAVFRPSAGLWYILGSTAGFSAVQFGVAGDVPASGDYDGDGRDDIAIFRPSTGVWYILGSAGSTVITQFGANGDRVVRGDYDGDGRTDLAIYRDGQWWMQKSTGGVSVVNFGNAADLPVPADYDGDGIDDVAVYRPSDGVWYVIRSSNGQVDYTQFGISTDIPAPGDYDGDGKADQAIFRGGFWYLNRSTAGFSVVGFGVAGDKPVAAGYLP